MNLLISVGSLAAMMFVFWRWLLSPVISRIDANKSAIAKLMDDVKLLEDNKVSRLEFTDAIGRLTTEISGMRADVFNFHKELLNVVYQTNARMDNLRK